MDEAVLRALARWPNVPSVYGWLALDRRGNWLIKGEPIRNPGVQAFIARNYESDDRGRWFFQNGPQRVFVSLARLPYVLRAAAGEPLQLETHTGVPVAHVTGALLDDDGGLILRWPGGVGSVDDRDLARVAGRFTDAGGRSLTDAELEGALDAGSRGRRAGFCFDFAGERLPIGRLQAAQLSQKFGFDPDPRPAPGEPEC